MNTLWQDLRYAARMLKKAPGFSLLALLTLALGIGANTAIYSVVMTVLVRPLPYQDAERLVWLANTNQSLGTGQTFLNQEDILDYGEQAQSIEQIAAWGTYPRNLLGGRQPERIETIYATPNLFRTLGVQPLLGRDFVPAEGAEDSHVALISYSLWQRQFGGDPAVIGRKIVLAGSVPEPKIIIGVMPPEVNFPPRIELFTTYQLVRFGRGGSHNDRAIARLKPGVTIEQAQAELSAIARRQAQQFPETNKGWDVMVVPLREQLFGSANVALPLLFGAVLFVLLIAWTNVAGLQLARAVARQKEIAIRLALGAPARRIVRQLLLESLLLAGLGGALGLLLARWGIDALRALGPTSWLRLQDTRLDVQGLAFTVVISVVAGVLFGLVPALQAANTDLNAALKDTQTNTPQRQRLRSLLVSAQCALALVLLFGAGLLIKSFWKLQQSSPGFESEHVLAVGLSLNRFEYSGPRLTNFYQQSLERLAQLPGVEAAAGVSHLPFGGRTMQMNFLLAGQEPAAKENIPLADYRVVTPALFETLRIPLKRGRTFTANDTTKTPLVYVVNEAFARTYFPGSVAVGQRLKLGYEGEWPGEIIGVVGDVKHRQIEAEAFPTVYVCYLQCTTQPNFPIMNYLVRTKGAASALAASVRRELLAAAPDQVIFYVRPLDEFISDAAAQRRFSMLLLALFAGVALLLATVGLYGLISYLVTQRSREMAIRLALGAQTNDVLKLIIGQGMKLVLSGVLAGLVAAVALARLMQSLLFGISKTDPLTLIVTGLLLLSVALLACYIPARRATKVDPLVALRCE
jgi:putative ABC transport system permease protein